MRITESRLRRVISNVISEMSDMMPPAMMPQPAMPDVAGVGHGMSSFMNKALSCCRMAHEDAAKLFDMCAQICAKNPSKASHCAELCACACCDDHDGCCRCLSEICKCNTCAKICFDCCEC